MLSPYKETFKLIFEVGIGTNNLDVPSNMGENGKPGASLKMWRNYFKKAKIYGADIDTRILFNSNKIKTYYVDQYSKKSIKKMWSSINKKNFDRKHIRFQSNFFLLLTVAVQVARNVFIVRFNKK